MKVLMLGWELPPYNSGGLGIACYQLCKALATRNVSLEFMLPYRAPHDIGFMKVTAAQPINVETVLRSGIAYDSYRYVLRDGSEQSVGIYEQQELYAEAVPHLTLSEDYDIVHAHDWLTFRAGLRVKEQKGCPLILHVHSVESDRAGAQTGNPLVREIEEQAFLIADRIIAVSQHTKNCIVRDYGIPENKIEVVHNSIDASEIKPLDSGNTYRYLTLMKQLGYRVVVNVGRLTVQKGLPNLLQAAKLVIEKNPKTLFLIVGSGEQYHELIELACSLGIGDKVIFSDFQRGKRWRDAFAVGDLFVMPSVSEPFGLTPLEAIAYGTPALVSHQAGVSEILRNCLKVDYWDTREMANQICAVLQHDELREELCRAAKFEYHTMSWHQASEKVSSIYTQHIEAVAA